MDWSKDIECKVNGGLIAGIVIAVIFAMGLCCVCCYCCIGAVICKTLKGGGGYGGSSDWGPWSGWRCVAPGTLRREQKCRSRQCTLNNGRVGKINTQERYSNTKCKGYS